MTIDNGGKTVNLIHVDFDDDFDDSYYEQAAEQIYDNGGYNPEMLSTQKGSALINETFRVFNTAIDKGLGQEPDPAVSTALRENAFIFSGFKTHAELEQVSQMLTDEKGNIKPFNEFLNDIQSINKDYNHNYLRTEYNQALQAAQMAGKWADFEKNKNFINLQYRTANDERVRASHRILHGTTLPVDDPFWKQYTPPNGWGCRCTVVAVLKDDYPVQDSHGSIAKAESCFKTPKEKMFKENLAEKKRLFPSKHPYFPKSCNSCPLNNGKQLAGTDGKKDCNSKVCKVIKNFKEKVEGKAAPINERENKKRKNRAMKDKVTNAAKGVGAYSVSKESKNLFINSECDKNELQANKTAAIKIINAFPEVIVHIRPDIKQIDLKNPEYLINDILADRKGINSLKKGISAGFSKAIDQGSSIVVIDCDYSTELQENFNLERLANKLQGRWEDFEEGIIKECYVIHNGKVARLTKNQVFKDEKKSRRSVLGLLINAGL